MQFAQTTSHGDAQQADAIKKRADAREGHRRVSGLAAAAVGRHWSPRPRICATPPKHTGCKRSVAYLHRGRGPEALAGLRHGCR